MITKKIFAYLTAITCCIVFTQVATAQPWNAYNDFWINVPATGGAGDYPLTTWVANGGSTNANAWNYAAATVEGGVFPAQVGTYMGGAIRYGLTAGNTWAGPGESYTFGPGNYYIGYDMPVWPGIQIAKYNYVWDASVPGWTGTAGPNNQYLWVRPVYHSFPAVDNTAAILEWTAPHTGTYGFTATFAPGNYGGSSVSFAVVNSLGTVLVARQEVAQGSAAQTFTFTNTLTAGDVVQFQIGAPTDNACPVGVFAQVTALPVPTTNVFTSGPNPSSTGSNVTFTATISSGAGTPSGTVEFRTNGVAFGSAALSGGVATLSSSVLPHGSNTVSAAYLGNTSYVSSTNSLVQVVSAPPVAKPITNGAPPGATSSIRIIGGKVSIAPTDVDGDPMLVSYVQNPSALLGAIVTTDGTNIFYTPGLNVSGADTLQYVVSDDYGRSGTNTIYVTVANQSLNIVSGPTLTNNQFQVTFAGITNYTYAVDESTLSVTGPWTFYTNLTPSANGLFQLVVTNDPPVGMRFFRTRPAP